MRGHIGESICNYMVLKIMVAVYRTRVQRCDQSLVEYSNNLSEIKLAKR